MEQTIRVSRTDNDHIGVFVRQKLTNYNYVTGLAISNGLYKAITHNFPIHLTLLHKHIFTELQKNSNDGLMAIKKPKMNNSLFDTIHILWHLFSRF